MMTGLMLAAVLLDRDASSLYLVAWAAAVVLLLAPESLTGPSFQLSFAAVIALVAAWEAVSRRRRARPSGGRGPAVQAARYVAGVAATSVVASVATAPRSEERRDGKECVSQCRSRWSADTSKKQTTY